MSWLVISVAPERRGVNRVAAAVRGRVGRCAGAWIGGGVLAAGRSSEILRASGQCNPPAASARHWPRGPPRKHRPFCTTNHNQLGLWFCLVLDSVCTKVSRPQSRVSAKTTFRTSVACFPLVTPQQPCHLFRGVVSDTDARLRFRWESLCALQRDAWFGEFLRGPIGCVATSNERIPSSGKKAPGTRSVRAKE